LDDDNDNNDNDDVSNLNDVDDENDGYDNDNDCEFNYCDGADPKHTLPSYEIVIHNICIIYSLLNDKSLETTIMEKQNTISYNIGGKILTYAALKSLSLAKV